MKNLCVILVFCFGLLPIQTLSQQLSIVSCDSLVLTREEFRKCIADSIYSTDILLKVKYISSLKTELLPKYRVQRKKIGLPEDLKLLISQLKHVYDSVLNHKVNVWEKEMDENQKYIQPKAYISSLLSFQLFKFYPDVFAILLNEIHLQLNPKTSLIQIDNVKKMIDKATMLISPEIHQQIAKITGKLVKEKDNLAKTLNIAELFQGDINNIGKIKYDVINFLIWTE